MKPQGQTYERIKDIEDSPSVMTYAGPNPVKRKDTLTGDSDLLPGPDRSNPDTRVPAGDGMAAPRVKIDQTTTDSDVDRHTPPSGRSRIKARKVRVDWRKREAGLWEVRVGSLWGIVEKADDGTFSVVSGVTEKGKPVILIQTSGKTWEQAREIAERPLVAGAEAEVRRQAGSVALEKGFKESDADPKELAMGVAVELEHTDDVQKSKDTALDHLAEMPDYYSRLKKMEAEGGVTAAAKPEPLGSVWTATAKCFAGERLVGYTVDTPNSIAQTLKDHSEIDSVKDNLGKTWTRAMLASRIFDREKEPLPDRFMPVKAADKSKKKDGNPGGFTFESKKAQVPTTLDFGDGPVPAHHHTNGGGWVADSASVDPSAYVSPSAYVFGDAKVSGDAKVFGNAYVFGNAQVFGDARVTENARVSGNAYVLGNARVSGNAHVFGDAQVYGNAQVFGNAEVYGDASVLGNAVIKTGSISAGEHTGTEGDAMPSGVSGQGLYAKRKSLSPRWHRWAEKVGGLNSREALFGFISWLTCRPGTLKVGAAEVVPPLPELLTKWADFNNLPKVREEWTNYLRHPTAQVVATDRYDALGIDHPDPKTVCDGQCEGTGIVPVGSGEADPVFKKLWDEAEAKEHAEDGTHFVKCPDCGGTGKRTTALTATDWQLGPYGFVGKVQGYTMIVDNTRGAGPRSWRVYGPDGEHVASGMTGGQDEAGAMRAAEKAVEAHAGESSSQARVGATPGLVDFKDEEVRRLSGVLDQIKGDAAQASSLLEDLLTSGEVGSTVSAVDAARVVGPHLRSIGENLARVAFFRGAKRTAGVGHWTRQGPEYFTKATEDGNARVLATRDGSAWYWEVIENGEVVSMGASASPEEAQAAADAAVPKVKGFDLPAHRRLRAGFQYPKTAQYAELRNALLYAGGVLERTPGLAGLVDSIDYAVQTGEYEELFEAAEDVIEAVNASGRIAENPDLEKVLDRIETGIQAVTMMAGPLKYANKEKP